MVISQNKIDGITKYFDSQPKLAFTDANLLKIFEKEKKDWGFKNSISPERILADFLKSDFFKTKAYIDQKGAKRTIYYFNTEDELSILSAISAGGYFAYHTALKLHGLTSTKKDTYYLTKERNTYEEAPDDNELSQESIDYSFSNPQRGSTNIHLYKRKRIMVTSGKRLDGLGIITKIIPGINYQYTDLERTLIDIAVRPKYSGGSLNVLKAFKKSKGKTDLIKLKTYLDQMHYIYPYHQLIGFYLKRAGYPKKDYSIFRTEIKFNFYLDYALIPTEFDDEWHIYHDL
jgi:hypothetical protein